MRKRILWSSAKFRPREVVTAGLRDRCSSASSLQSSTSTTLLKLMV